MSKVNEKSGKSIVSIKKLIPIEQNELKMLYSIGKL